MESVLLYNPEFEVTTLIPEDWSELLVLFPDGPTRQVAEKFHEVKNEPISFGWIRLNTSWFPLRVQTTMNKKFKETGLPHRLVTPKVGGSYIIARKRVILADKLTE